MASIKAYEKEDGTLVITFHGKGKEAKLLSKHGCAFILGATKVYTNSSETLLGTAVTTVTLHIPQPKHDPKPGTEMPTNTDL